MKQPKIDVRIPFEPQGKLGVDYNRIMNESVHDWVLFVDHDVLLATNLHWYHICQQAIINYSDAALFTCYTNNIGCKYQRHEKAPKNQDIIQHREFAKYLWDTYKYNCQKIKEKGKLLSGFLFLVSKKYWEIVGGFAAKGMYKEDNYYHKKLNNHKLPVYLIQGLYCYHLRDRSGNSWIEDELINVNYIKKKG